MTTIGSLFSGIGGLDGGLEAALHDACVLWQVEIDPFCRRVLERHWPHAHRHEDVRHVGAHNLETVDVMCGGFPCTGMSPAGKRRGFDDAGSALWAEYRRIVGALRPSVVVIENSGHGHGSWVPHVRADLADLGYASIPLSLSAAEVGAPHERKRAFVVAHADGDALRRLSWWWCGSRGSDGPTVARESGEQGRAPADAHVLEVDVPAPAGKDATDATGSRVERAAADPCLCGGSSRSCDRCRGEAAQPEPHGDHHHGSGPNADAQGLRQRERQPGRSLGDGPAHWAHAPSEILRVVHGLPAGVDGPRRRRPVNDAARISALGNSVVPHVAYRIGEAVAFLLASVAA